MRLRNKKTGEVVEDAYVRETHDFQFDGQKHILAVFRGNGHRPPERISGPYNSLAELNEEWEDYKEPKDDGFEHIITLVESYSNLDDEWYPKGIVEKLKALQRLKNKGFRFTFIYLALPTTPPLTGWINYKIEPSNGCLDKETRDGLDLLFGGEDE